MGKIKQQENKIKRLKEKLAVSRKNVVASRNKFQRELKKSVNTAIIAAFSFLIALAWKDVITEYVEKISEVSPVKGKLISALIITLVSVMGMLIATRILAVKD